MSMQGFRGNCDSQGKLGMCPSLAESDSGGIPRTSRRQLKSFLIQQFFKNVGEVQGKQPMFAKQMKLHNETQQKSRREPQRIAIAYKIERL
jgi:hypothetical protein